MAVVGNFYFSIFLRLTWKFLDLESERGGSFCWPNNKIIDRHGHRPHDDYQCNFKYSAIYSTCTCLVERKGTNEWLNQITKRMITVCWPSSQQERMNDWTATARPWRDGRPMISRYCRLERCECDWSGSTYCIYYCQHPFRPYISTHANCQVVVCSASMTNYYGYLSSVSIYTTSRAGNGMMDHACWMLTQQSQFWFDLQLKILTPTHGPPNWSASPIGQGGTVTSTCIRPKSVFSQPASTGLFVRQPNIFMDRSWPAATTRWFEMHTWSLTHLPLCSKGGLSASIIDCFQTAVFLS